MKLIVPKKFMFLSCKNFNLPKKVYNFKKEVKKHTFEHKNNKECSKNYVYFIVESNNHYTKNEYNIPNFSHNNPLGRGETMVYPKNQGNPNLKKIIIVNPIYKSSSKDILIN
jgi:hypothetical protein